MKINLKANSSGVYLYFRSWVVDKQKLEARIGKYPGSRARSFGWQAVLPYNTFLIDQTGMAVSEKWNVNKDLSSY